VKTEAMIDSIVQRIGPMDAAVERMPDKVTMRFAHRAAAVWVGYHDSRFERPENLDHPVQMRHARFDIAVLVRQLHGPRGATAYLDAVSERLHGWRLPQGGTPLILEDERYVDYDNGVWRYDLLMSTQMPRVPHVSDAPGPAFTLVQFESDGGTTEVVPDGGGA
jgi:hypothetical protein